MVTMKKEDFLYVYMVAISKGDPELKKAAHFQLKLFYWFLF